MEPSLFKNGDGQRLPPPAPPLSDEQKRQIAAFREHVYGSLGRVVLAMAATPRYRHHSLADLQSLALEPLLAGRVAIAMATEKDGEPTAAAAGVAIWASVSEEVDAKIREQIKTGVFPLRLKAQDWASGDKHWLLDVIAPTQKLASLVVANFRQVVKEGELRIHPMAARMVDKDMLERMAAASAGGGRGEGGRGA